LKHSPLSVTAVQPGSIAAIRLPVRTAPAAPRIARA